MFLVILFQSGLQEDNATRMSAVGLSRFLSLFFNFVKVENPASHKYVVVNGIKSQILSLLKCGYSLETFIQNDDGDVAGS